MTGVTAILLAAGRGERVGGETPKQFLDLAGIPVCAHSLLALDAVPAISSIVVVLPDDAPEFVHRALSSQKVVSVATGGPTRQASLGQGLICVPDDTTHVLVHDAARPLLTPLLTTSVWEALIDRREGMFRGAIPVVPTDDALKETSSSGEVIGRVRRGGVVRAQTPQAFEREALEDSLARADSQGVIAEDCSQLLTDSGYRVTTVAGDPTNLKITRPRDLALCEAILSSRGTIYR